jgi:hypothetical protein
MVTLFKTLSPGSRSAATSARASFSARVDMHRAMKKPTPVPAASARRQATTAIALIVYDDWHRS